MADGWEVTPTHFHNAFQGVLMQAKAHGLDVNDRNINNFLSMQAEVIAAAIAGQDFYARALIELTMNKEITN